MPARTVGNIRKNFKIKGHEWRVLYKHNLTDPELGPCHGLCVADERIIYIEAKLPAEKKWHYFLHELTHAIEAELHITIDDTTSEILAEGLADILNKLFVLEWRNSRKRKPKAEAPVDQYLNLPEEPPKAANNTDAKTTS